MSTTAEVKYLVKSSSSRNTLMMKKAWNTASSRNPIPSSVYGALRMAIIFPLSFITGANIA